jgi:hypothetical protein
MDQFYELIQALSEILKEISDLLDKVEYIAIKRKK